MFYRTIQISRLFSQTNKMMFLISGLKSCFRNFVWIYLRLCKKQLSFKVLASLFLQR